MAEDPYNKLYDGKTYKIYRNGLFDYTVTSPTGRIVSSSFTYWCARLALHRAMRRAARRRWWEDPIVIEVEPGGDR